MSKKLVFIASPLSASGPIGVEINLRYAQECVRYSAALGEAPYAPHLYLPQALDDNNPEERKLGMDIGKEYLAVCQELKMCCDRGVSSGMISEFKLFLELHGEGWGKRQTEIRLLKGGSPPTFEEILRLAV